MVCELDRELLDYGLFYNKIVDVLDGKICISHLYICISLGCMYNIHIQLNT